MDQSCLESRCCADAGHQCYAKHSGQATCMAECMPGPSLYEPRPIPWSCQKFGDRAPGEAPPTPPEPESAWLALATWVASVCSKPGEDCSSSRCCVQNGTQCFRKSEWYSGCKASCSPGPDLHDVNSDPWSCEKLGFRTPGVAAAAVSRATTAAWVVSECTRINENCTKTKCCRDAGAQCFEKDNETARCMHACVPGEPNPFDTDFAPWSCRELGPTWTPASTVVTSAMRKLNAEGPRPPIS